jgi:hypothetical protein
MLNKIANALEFYNFGYIEGLVKSAMCSRITTKEYLVMCC